MKRGPKHLSKDAREFYRQVLDEYDLDVHHEKILIKACEAYDRAEQARKILDEKGLTMLDRFDQEKTRPEVAIERDSRIAFARLIRELGLDLEPPEEPGRPPRQY